MGLPYDDICRQHLIAAGSRLLGWQPLRVGRYWDSRAEIDLVAVDAAGERAAFVDCKWGRSVDVPRVVRRLREKARAVVPFAAVSHPTSSSAALTSTTSTTSAWRDARRRSRMPIRMLQRRRPVREAPPPASREPRAVGLPLHLKRHAQQAPLQQARRPAEQAAVRGRFRDDHGGSNTTPAPMSPFPALGQSSSVTARARASPYPHSETDDAVRHNRCIKASFALRTVWSNRSVAINLAFCFLNHFRWRRSSG